MNITPITNNYYTNYSKTGYRYAQNNTLKPQTPTFQGGGINAFSEKKFHKFEYFLRVISNRFLDRVESQTSKQITKNIAQIEPTSSKKYLNQLDAISRYYASNKTIDVNIEDKILEKVAKGDKSVIFIMNHSNQRQDPSMLAVLNSLLVEAYEKSGKENNFPIPKIILNKDILTSMNPTKRKAFEAFGAVGVDANIHNADKRYNARAFLPIIKDFIKDKCNIFIFPEGKLAVRKEMSFDSRFQTGIAELINKALAIKKEVTVVPVGFSYGKGKNKTLNGMQIGEPVVFKRDKDVTTVSHGSVLKSEFGDKSLKDFFSKHKDENDVVITSGGIPVKNKEATDYIKGILSDNLEICAKEANKKLKTPLNDNTPEIV